MCVEPGALDVGVCVPRPPFRPGLGLILMYIRLSSDNYLYILWIRLNEYHIIMTPSLQPKR